MKLTPKNLAADIAPEPVRANVKALKGYFVSKSSRTLQTVFLVSEKCLL